MKTNELVPFWLRMIDYVLLVIMLPYDFLMVFINPFEWVKKPEFLRFPSYDEKIQAERKKKELKDLIDQIKYGVTQEEDELDAMLGIMPRHPKNIGWWDVP